MSEHDPADISDSPDVQVPPVPASIAAEHPDLWRAFQQLGKAAGEAGTLDARTRRLVHLALAIAANSEGATHSHARRAMEEGLGPDELDQVAFLAITTLGWPQAIRGLSWIRDISGSPRDKSIAGA